ncbi:hypothetical protein ABPG75_008834 [Micractinium tetrahymenae]
MATELASPPAAAVEVYPPPERVQKGAAVTSMEQYREMYERSLKDPEGFWGELMERFHWRKKWDSGENFHKWNFDTSKGPIHCSWFNGAETSMCYNCLDLAVQAGNGDRICYIWEGNDPGQERNVTYKQMLDMVCQIGSYLRSQGVGKGDEVAIYMPMIPELPATMLACSRIGAIFSVVFAGFSAESLAGRLSDPYPKVLFTCSAVRRGPKPIMLKKIVNDALNILAEQDAGDKVYELPPPDARNELLVPHVVVFDHEAATGIKREDLPDGWVEGRDVWWQDVILGQPTECDVTWCEAEHPLFKLYTSGSTGKPKGVVHTTAGFMCMAATTCQFVFDLKPEDIFWCTADIGWITGHTYVAFGPLLNGCTQILFEGIPTFPHDGRCLLPCLPSSREQVTVFYTAPTAIRTLMARGDSHVTRFKRTSIRILGTVGEPINPEAWRWYHDIVGNGEAAVVDTWWQTETGAHMITPLPGATPTKAGAATFPFFGVEPALLDFQGNEIQGVGEGYLVMKRPWPALARTLAGDHPRYEQTYFGHYKGYYFTGDGARRDEDGYYWISGRVDDVINVSGHRLGTAEVENALVGHHLCAEAAVVPLDHPVKGQCIYAFVTLMEGMDYPPDELVRKQLVEQVRKAIGPIATPDVIHWAPSLPKTRSGKIMRRVLRKIASNKLGDLGDTSTLADPSVIDVLVSLRGK